MVNRNGDVQRNATAVIWRMLMVAENRFRRLGAPELLAVVATGEKFVDGQPMQREGRKAVAR